MTHSEEYEELAEAIDFATELILEVDIPECDYIIGKPNMFPA